MNNKGIAELWWIIIVFVVLAVAAIVILVGFNRSYGGETKIIQGQLNGTCASISGATCKDSCDTDEKFVLGIYSDCKLGKSCCVKK